MIEVNLFSAPLKAFWPCLAVIALSPFIGSFLGVVILRLPMGLPILWARSACGFCNRRLRAGDLIPLMSWFWQRGRCRACGQRLGWFYPGVECAACLVAFSALVIEPEGGLALYLITAALGWCLLTLSWIDTRTLRLPNLLTFPLIVAGLGAIAWINPNEWSNHLIGAVGGYLIIAATAVTYRHFRGRDGMGGGDRILFAAVGAWLGWQALPSVLLIASIVGLALTIFTRSLFQLKLNSKIPFGPYLSISFYYTWLYGPLHFIL